MSRDTTTNDAPVLRCSFCKKAQDDVRKLIAGPSVNICDECVDVCAEIIADDSPLEGASEVTDGALVKEASGPAVRCALCRMPTPVEDGVLIANRGVLCPGCIGEIEATIAEIRQVER